MNSRHVKIPRTPTGFEKRLGHTFSTSKILRDALTHSTYANENPSEKAGFHRLEFIGDAVLGLLTSQLLFAQFKNSSKSELSRCRERLIGRNFLAKLATHLGLTDHLRLSEGQKHDDGGIDERVLANAFEALVGAIFLDGGYEAVELCFTYYILADIERTQESLDFKTRLQEVCRQSGLPAPSYVVVNEIGLSRAHHIQCEVRILGERRGVGAGSNRKAAEQTCARHVLDFLRASTIKK